MNIAEYWNEKAKLLDNAFENWNKDEEIQIRKMVIAKMMDIPTDEITYYLRRDEWYRKFALDDVTEINKALTEEESFKEKVQNILEEYFYKKDYEELYEIKKTVKTETSDKNNNSEKPLQSERSKVCECIKDLVEDNVYKNLKKTNKAKLDTFEKIYFVPIELFNDYVEETIGSEAYYSILLEQWKTANEMAANISAQRNNMNNFYMSLMSILIGGILLSDQVLETNLLVTTVLYGAILVIGAVCCNKWISQIDNYGRLNTAKYDVINGIERKLPANVMLYEYLQTEQNARRSKLKISFSKQEKEIAQLFRVVMILIPVMMLLFSWGEFIWTLI